MRNTIAALIFALLQIVSLSAFSQVTKIRGVIFDSETNEPIPFANVVMDGTSAGTITDFEGNYFIETRLCSDSLFVSYIGYKPVRKKIVCKSFQQLNVKLDPVHTELEEVVVTPGENPAHPLFRKVIANKKKNDPRRIENYQCEVYNKLEFDISNIDESLKDKAFFKQFPMIFDYVDTSAITGSTFLPVFISESVSKTYHRAKPEAKKEEIIASKISGIKNESISQFTGDMYLNVPIYDNYIDVLGKSFVSPAANFGLLYYKYYLIDSAYRDNRWCYLLSFKPKSRQEPTFTGKMWIHDTTFAITSFEIRINEHANINFVNDLVVSHDYSFVNDSIWLLQKETMFLDLNIAEKTYGVLGNKTTSYRNYQLGKDYPDKFFAGSTENIEVADDAMEKKEEYWDTARYEQLSEKELGTYQMMDTITNMPIFKTYIDVIKMFMTGYKEFKYWELGPYFTMYSYNEIEGHRFRMGGRTTAIFNDKYRYGAYTAYGTRDHKFKYGGTVEWMIKKRPQQKAMVSYKNDLEQLGQSPNALREDNIMSSFFRRTPNNKLTWVEEGSVTYGQDWNRGFSNSVQITHRKMSPSEYVKFAFLENGAYVPQKQIYTADLKLSTRWAFNEKFIYNKFDRTSMGTDYPVLNLDLSYCLLNPYSTLKPYYKTVFGIEQEVDVNPIGYFDYLLEAGKVWGTLPYPLLELHKGNETYTYDDYAFNLMNYYEFVSDQYVSFGVTHHFDGFFLNKVPLFKRLKLREVVTGKTVMGWLSDQNRVESEFPGTLGPLTSPYAEGGVGIENIFKIFRVDALWRFTQLDNPNVAKFGIRVKVQFQF